jgi:hypothetical protein
MTYVLLALGLLLLAMGLLFLAGARRHRRITPRLPSQPIRLTPQTQLERLQKAGKFRGVHIGSHCAASSQLAAREFSFESAPQLPVQGCDAHVCECGYIGLPERRSVIDRRSGRDRRESLRTDSNDRRGARPRRAVDLNSWAAHRHL